jgi:hypothetical protein
MINIDKLYYKMAGKELNKHLRILGLSSKGNRGWNDAKRMEKMLSNLVSTYDGTSYSCKENEKRIAEIIRIEFDIYIQFDFDKIEAMSVVTGLFVQMQQENRFVPKINSIPLKNKYPDEIATFMENNMNSQLLIKIALNEISYNMGNQWVVDTEKSIEYVNDVLEKIISVMDTYPKNMNLQISACDALFTMLSFRKTSSLYTVQMGACQRVIQNAKNNHMVSSEMCTITDKVQKLI